MVKRPGLTRDKVLRAALDLVDADGVASLSMRRLGEALGVEAMSLYRHVANKADLLDGIHEAVLAEVAVPPMKGPWTEQVRRTAHTFRTVLGDHPNTLPILATRPATGRAGLELVEHGLQILAAAGFSDVEALRAFHAIVAFVVGHAMSTFAVPDDIGGVDYAALPPGAFPQLTRMRDALASYDIDEEFELGLDAMISGLEQRLGK